MCAKRVLSNGFKLLTGIFTKDPTQILKNWVLVKPIELFCSTKYVRFNHKDIQGRDNVAGPFLTIRSFAKSQVCFEAVWPVL